MPRQTTPRKIPTRDPMHYSPRIKTNTRPIPTESQEQQALFQWANFQSGTYPELALMFHVPNGGSRHKLEAVRFKAEGVKAGVPDICLPVARGDYHGLYIELKREGGKLSHSQIDWLEALQRQKYCARVCYGWEDAAKMLMEYLRLEVTDHE